MPATSCYNSDAFLANYFKSAHASIYVSIGRTTPWADESSPPVPDPATTSISEIIGYKALEDAQVCYQDDASGTIVFQSHNYTPVASDEDAYTHSANYVYLKTSLLYGELPVGISFRQVGLQFELIPIGGYTSVIMPSGVSDPGKLLFISNLTPTTRDISKKEIVECLIEIR